MTERRTRLCPSCQRNLPLNQFRTRKSRATTADINRIGRPYGPCFECQRQTDMTRRATLHGYLQSLSRNIRLRCTKKSLNFELTPEVIAQKYLQQWGLCAVTKEPLTFIVGQGITPTNISVDRIQIGGDYTRANTRLVCYMVNVMRSTSSDDEFVEWCEKILAGRPFLE